MKNVLITILCAVGFILTLLGADAGNTISGWWGVLGAALFVAGAYLAGFFSNRTAA